MISEAYLRTDLVRCEEKITKLAETSQKGISDYGFNPKKGLQMDLKALEPILAPIVKQVWDGVIHPELLKLEAGIAQEDLKMVAAALDAALDKIVQAEIAKLAQ